MKKILALALALVLALGIGMGAMAEEISNGSTFTGADGFVSIPVTYSIPDTTMVDISWDGIETFEYSWDEEGAAWTSQAQAVAFSVINRSTREKKINFTNATMSTEIEDFFTLELTDGSLLEPGFQTEPSSDIPTLTIMPNVLPLGMQIEKYEEDGSITIDVSIRNNVIE